MPNTKLDKINQKIASGKMAEQSAASMIMELNSYSKEALERTAMNLGYKTLSYEKMFAHWNRYAKAFRRAGISKENHSRVFVMGFGEETITAFYALNMSGVSVSITSGSKMGYKSFMKQMKAEHITDLVFFADSVLTQDIKALNKLIEKYPFNSVILGKTKIAPQYIDEKMAMMTKLVCLRLLQNEKVQLLSELLSKTKKDAAIKASKKSNEDAFIVHTSGTTKGVSKPVPLSDQAINSMVLRFMSIDRFKDLRFNLKSVINFSPLNSSYLIDLVHMTHVFSGTLRYEPIFYKEHIKHSGENKENFYIVTDAGFNEFRHYEACNVSADLSSWKVIVFGGSYCSLEKRERINKTLEKYGCKEKLMVAYGLSEACSACTLSDPEDKSDTIGELLPGIEGMVLDESTKKFYDIKEGNHIGSLYLSSNSLSSGKIDDIQFFELEEIDGKKYLCTHDMVESYGDGRLRYIGRSNHFFVNNEGIRFDAGFIETVIGALPGVENLVLAPRYSKTIHDTVPVLYVKHELDSQEAAKQMEKEFKRIFIEEEQFKRTNLPVECIFVKNFPCTSLGKVDIYKVISNDQGGDKYLVNQVKTDGKLTDIYFEYREIVFPMYDDQFAIPDEYEKANKEAVEVLKQFRRSNEKGEKKMKKTQEKEFKEVGKQIHELRKEYAKKHEELDKEYFEKVKEVIPEDKRPLWMKEVKSEDFPKPFFMMEEEDFEKIREKRKEHFEKMREQNPLFKVFEMFAPDHDEDDDEDED